MKVLLKREWFTTPPERPKSWQGDVGDLREPPKPKGLKLKNTAHFLTYTTSVLSEVLGVKSGCSKYKKQDQSIRKQRKK